MKLAILDIDGTLYGGTLGIDLLKELAREQLLAPEAFEQILETMQAYESGQLSRAELAQRVYELYGEGITGLDREVVAEAARRAWERNKHRVFPYVEELLELLKSDGYTTVAMTGSPVEIAKDMAGTYHIDHLYAADFQTVNGKYTGELAFSPGQAGLKRSTLEKLARQMGADLSRSVALGDSENDFELFDLVGMPIAVNAPEELAQTVREQGWQAATPEDLLPLVRDWLDRHMKPDGAN